MKLFKRKTATIQDYINFIGMVLFIWIIVTKEVMTGSFDEMFVMDNVLVLVCLGISVEMLFINLSIFVTDFKNHLFERMQEKKYGKRKDNDEEKES